MGVDNPPSITCPRCGRTSYHPKDIEERYCGFCHEFHETMPKASAATSGRKESEEQLRGDGMLDGFSPFYYIPKKRIREKVAKPEYRERYLRRVYAADWDREGNLLRVSRSMSDTLDSMNGMMTRLQASHEKCLAEAIKEHGPRNGWIKKEAVEIFELDGEECWIAKSGMWDKMERAQSDPALAKIAKYLNVGYCGYVCFKEKPVIEPDCKGILTYIPVHGGITWAVHDEIGSVYGFDTGHHNSSEYPIRDTDWIKKEILLMVLAIKMAAKIEPEYLAADGDNQRRAELVQPLVELGDDLNFMTMLNMLSGEL